MPVHWSPAANTTPQLPIQVPLKSASIITLGKCIPYPNQTISFFFLHTPYGKSILTTFHVPILAYLKKGLKVSNVCLAIQCRLSDQSTHQIAAYTAWFLYLEQSPQHSVQQLLGLSLKPFLTKGVMSAGIQPLAQSGVGGKVAQ